MTTPAKRIGAYQLIASTDATYPNLDDVPGSFVQQLDGLQPNWRRIIELARETISDDDD
ncbi:MAG: hypothetical protein QM728_11595 [Gordonia sp. (in: high G+C Gram-positive bacteria)]|uniref:hypothetical protein n=1 Tax=Gordonia sp. (in: high G+C Gram-positive bacteria) TaxID=84139 RepID=UPI0039E589A1